MDKRYASNLIVDQSLPIKIDSDYGQIGRIRWMNSSPCHPTIAPTLWGRFGWDPFGWPVRGYRRKGEA